MNYTPKQIQVLRLVFEYQNQHGYAPTYAELAKELNVSSITVFEHLEALERKGAVRRRRHEARSTEILDHSFLHGLGAGKPLSVKGLLTAGRPIAPAENTKEDLLEGILSPEANTFLLKVRGDSLADEGLLDGDFVVLEGRAEARDGETVVALLEDGTATLRRFFRDEGRVRLMSANPHAAPLYARKVRIFGVYKGLVRIKQ